MTTPTIPPVTANAPIRLTWSGIEAFTRELAAQVGGDGMPETVVGIMRGGMIPAVMVAHQLGIRDVRTIEVTHTVTDGVNAAKTSAPAYKNPTSLGDLAGRDVLLVDDIAGSGATLERTRRMVAALGVRRLRTAVLTVNRANWHAPDAPEERIDYIAEHTDTWVIFPWETADGPKARAAAATPTTGDGPVPQPSAASPSDRDQN
ncbi:phosphoribosyltransferase family protein (plasmid) [Streptomyces sp. NBC_00445]|uniref:phosphoribosyltransferase n=1 Tax=Streptomyces sp. NBC_00445 TaxID=2975745 RepID=UPI002E21E714